MRRRFFVKGLSSSGWEQDVKVTVSQSRDVKPETGDEVDVLVRGTVGTVYGENGEEIEIVNTQPIKVIAVRRKKA